ncbi:exonuclease, DNA polymerase III, epsilon subunit family [Allopseudospirillum japonicum]|uniref:DNA-directed DNA polymerase n=1 Tax=Allopseudospirillum japonicum TaxID=64971 RepID=A0A1H6TD70_9GAMM|nr:exonuclease domain-containing protein [Allopseudospirillum japonicum]SEI74230.1 exonuclease, DNA polymerase III, epsilon subunit family [Allopseudospirillum japonicum]
MRILQTLPSHQNLLGLWLLLTALLACIGLGMAVSLHPYVPAHLAWLLWGLAFVPSLLCLGLGYLLQQVVILPLRHFHTQLESLTQGPGPYPGAQAWLSGLNTPLTHLIQTWQQDRQQAQDVQAQAEIQHLEHELEVLIHSLPLALVLLDRHRRVLLFNQAAAQIFSHPYHLGLGRIFDEVLQVPHLDEYQACLSRYLATATSERQPTAIGHQAKLWVCVQSTWYLLHWHAIQDEYASDWLLYTLPPALLNTEMSAEVFSQDWLAFLVQSCAPDLEITPIGLPLWLCLPILSINKVLLPRVRAWAQALHTTQLELHLHPSETGLVMSLRAPDAPKLAPQEQAHWLQTWQVSQDPHLKALQIHNTQLQFDFSTGQTYAEAFPVHTDLPARPSYQNLHIAQWPAPETQASDRLLTQTEFVVFDTETTGLELTRGDKVVSLGACRLLPQGLLTQETFLQHINPERPIPASSTRFHGLTDEDVADAPPIAWVLPQFYRFAGRAVLVAHNAAFDYQALYLAEQATHPQTSVSIQDFILLDTWHLSRFIWPQDENHSLDALAERLHLSIAATDRHTALGDALLTAQVLLALLPKLAHRGILTLADALALHQMPKP